MDKEQWTDFRNEFLDDSRNADAIRAVSPELAEKTGIPDRVRGMSNKELVAAMEEWIGDVFGGLHYEVAAIVNIEKFDGAAAERNASYDEVVSDCPTQFGSGNDEEDALVSAFYDALQRWEHPDEYEPSCRRCEAETEEEIRELRAEIIRLSKKGGGDATGETGQDI